MTPARKRKTATRPMSGGGDMPVLGEVVSDNREWQLADFVDAVASEIDRAEDTLSLKSHARGVTFALKQLNLELEVKVRRDTTGRILFRTTNPDEASATVLKLDLAQMLQGQLHALRKPLNDANGRDLNTLPEITAIEIAALNNIAIYSVDDLERYTQSTAMIVEVARKSNIADARLRRWLGLPYIAELKPPAGAPGSTVLIEGGNFGAIAAPSATILFQGQPLNVLSWSDGRISVQMPQLNRGSGALFAVINNQTTNALNWEVSAVDLVVRDIVLLEMPQQLFANEPIEFRAILANQGSSSSAQQFEVQWLIDDQTQAPLPHGLLQPGQDSQESSTRLTVKLPEGEHVVRFIADPEGVHPDLNRANGSFALPFVVEARRELRMGDFRNLSTLDPTRSASADLGAIYGLIFRGLLRLQPNGAPVPDLASGFRVDPQRPDGNIAFVFDLTRPKLQFHSGQPVTAEDIVYTYEQLRESPAWGELMKSTVREVQIQNNQVIFIMNGRQFPKRIMALFTVGIVPRDAHQSSPIEFAQNPIGCGPFKVAQFNGDQLLLDGFDGYFLGRPRLNRIQMEFTSADPLVGRLIKGHLAAISLPKDDTLIEQLSSEPNLVVWQPQSNDAAPLVYAQTNRLQQREQNLFDPSAGAHLWYLSGEDDVKSHTVGRVRANARVRTRRTRK